MDQLEKALDKLTEVTGRYRFELRYITRHIYSIHMLSSNGKHDLGIAVYKDRRLSSYTFRSLEQMIEFILKEE